MTNYNRINILPPEVFNLIAAGEVVERPTSALKELVENSIDSGAHRIAIEVANGGYDLIAVSDNGCGIYEDDIEAAFFKHATSKLVHADDLNSIQTLGFRGEALSSIAAVARVTMTTRQSQADTAVCVNVEGGKIVSREYVTANVGTKIEVRDLYYNVPARRKFMKEGKNESGDLTKYVAKLILTNPNLEIHYSVDGKTVYKTKGNGLAEAVFVVYGADCLRHCLAVSYEAEFFRITGYIGDITYTKPNSTYQTLAVNGRLIEDKHIQGAILRAFQPYLMTRQYPFFVLDLSIPCDLVDVNVHPRKTEVRFERPTVVAGKFYHAVSDTLSKFTQDQVDEMFAEDENPDGNYTLLTLPSIRMDKDVECTSPLLNNKDEMTVDQFNDAYKIEESTRNASQMPLKEFADRLEKSLTVQSARRAIGLDDDNDGVGQSPATLSFPALEPELPPLGEVDKLLMRTRVLGAAFQTYLILEVEDKVIFVDQHAAHERILFDKFMDGKSSDMQPLMFPYVFHVRADEAMFIERNLENILKAGIEVEPFGDNTFRICAVSSLLADTKMEAFVQYLLAGADELEIDDRTLIVEKIAKKACKAAVKAGYTLSEFEIKYILRGIYENKILQCPHGRPITVVFTKAQLEKMFKRIV